MGALLGQIISALLPAIIRAIWVTIEKKNDADKSKENVIRLADSLLAEKNINVKFPARHTDTINQIRSRLS